MKITRRAFWNGPPERLPDGFTIKKPDGIQTHLAVCEVWTNVAGWELRLTMDGHALPLATVVQSPDEIRTLIESWKAALLEMGWS